MIRSELFYRIDKTPGRPLGASMLSFRTTSTKKSSFGWSCEICAGLVGSITCSYMHYSDWSTLIDSSCKNHDQICCSIYQVKISSNLDQCNYALGRKNSNVTT